MVRPSGPPATGQRGFATTHWSVVLAAAGSSTPGSRDALEALCQTYWYPLYAYVRHRGYSAHDAQDLTQEFFARLLEKRHLARLTREGGRFRSFLLKTMNRFLVDQWKKTGAQKRGGGQIVSLDAQLAETRYGREPVDTVTPAKLFDQNWAVTVLNEVFERLRRNYEAEGKGELFDQLKFCLTGDRCAVPYAKLAEQLRSSENTVKSWVRRLRQRYRELLRDEVAHTVADASDVEEELQQLFRALAP